MPKTLHIDTGRDMRGGSPLFREAREHGIDVRPLSGGSLMRMTRQVDLIHAHDARAHMLAAVAGRAPLMVSRRVAFPVRTSIVSRWKYARPVRYLSVSRFVAGRLRDAGVPDQKIRVVYDGVPIPAPSNPVPGRVVALASKSAEIVRRSAGAPIHFTSDLWQDLSTASIFIYVSELEGLGSAALAAMASGVPVIASAVGGLPEIVEHERTGLLVKDTEIGDALRRLLDDPAAAAEMGRRGRERVKEIFSVDAMVNGTLAVYREALRC